MKPLAFAEQMRELDRSAIEGEHIPSLDLMEQAALATTEEAMHFGQQMNVTIFCGPGNNGGDGVAAARLLLQRGCQVRTILVGDREKMTHDERAMEEKLIRAGGRLLPFADLDDTEKTWMKSSDLMIDALFGVGLCRDVGGDFKTAVEWMNEAPCPVISCDIPSGISADTGDILGVAVKADETVTFTCPKPGLYLGDGAEYAGTVKIAPIGVPEHLIEEQMGNRAEQMTLVSEERDKFLPRRARTAHKGNFGKLFVLAGSEGYTGAPVLASTAAVRAGAGLVFLGVPREVYPIVAVKCNEAMPYPLPEDYSAILKKARGCDVALIGPGLGRKPETEKLVLSLLEDLEIPVVLDADGLNALSTHIDVLDRRKNLTVLTPHDGEFQRLTGCALPIRNRMKAAKDFARAHNCVMILKGHGTVTADPEGNVFINDSGNPGMARGGSGDVLSGILAAFLAQKQLGDDPARVCACGVYCHGLAGDRCAERLGEYGMTPTDMIGELPLVLKDYTC